MSLWGTHLFSFFQKTERLDGRACSWLVRGLGIVYAIAFSSLAVQIVGLVGEHGILPAKSLVDQLLSGDGRPSFWEWPSIFRFGVSDAALQGACWLGTAAGVLVALGLCQAPLLALAWWFYLSVMLIGQVFLSFQWDILLLETGFMALLICPFGWTARRAWQQRVPAVAYWLPRWLLARLMLQSGLVKWASGDPTWRGLTALNFHFETQPLPNPLSWLVHRLPAAGLTFGVIATFFIELALPFAILAPRRVRYWVFWPLAGFQLLIVITGNYGFFNLLTLLLCLPLLDDECLLRLIPEHWRQAPEPDLAPSSRVRTWICSGFLSLAVIVGTADTLSMLGVPEFLPGPLQATSRFFHKFLLVNRYGLFAVMTTERNEIEFEGSRDGNDWLPYRFRYKISRESEAPPIVFGHMPRLDWQMWFAALGDYRASAWTLNFAERLLEGAEPVSRLLAEDPFAANPPKYVRANLYRYHFSRWEDLQRGAWWRREAVGVFLPPLSLK